MDAERGGRRQRHRGPALERAERHAAAALRRSARLGERWLPAAYRPVAIDLADTLLVRSSGTIVADADEVSHLDYTVESQLPPLAGDAITEAQKAATDAPVPPRLQRFVDLPGSPDIDEIENIATNVVTEAGATTPYAKAEALRNWFREDNRFTYDTTVGTTDNAPAILEFLNSRRGFCVQFASAYAVMARSLGIPARVAVGFTPGKHEAGDTYRVTSHDAHAWPEIYLAGMGWTAPVRPHAGQPGDRGQQPAQGRRGGHADAAHRPAATVTVPTSGEHVAGRDRQPDTPAPRRPRPRWRRSPRARRRAPAPGSRCSWCSRSWSSSSAATSARCSRLKRRRRAATSCWPMIPRPRSTGRGPKRSTGCTRPRSCRARRRPRSTSRPPSPAAPAPRPRVRCASSRAPYGAARYGDGALAPDDARVAWESLDELEHALDDGVSWTRRWRRRLDASTLVRR